MFTLAYVLFGFIHVCESYRLYLAVLTVDCQSTLTLRRNDNLYGSSKQKQDIRI